MKLDIDLNVYIHEGEKTSRLLPLIQQLTHKVDHVMASQSEQAQILRDVYAQQQKTAGEIATLQGSVDTLNTRIAELETAVTAGGDASQELIDAVAAVKQQAQVVDDQIPDAPVTGEQP